MEAHAISKPAHLEPSPLGTKEYWDRLYETEISNHAADPSDLGTIWFDDSSAEDKVLAFLHSPHLSLDHERTSFLDVGTGNGHFLFRLREEFPEDDDDEEGSGEEEEEEEEDGDIHEHEERNDDAHGENGGQSPSNRNKVRTGAFKGRMVGTDYSLKSIEFAMRVAATRDPPVHPAIEFVHCDIMAVAPASAIPPPTIEGTADTNTDGQNDDGSIVASSHHPLLTPPNTTGYDVVLDKGTFDAISLSDQQLDDVDAGAGAGAGTNGGGKRLCEGYKARILPLAKEGGIFVITSCNWTEAELRGWFEDDGTGAATGGAAAGVSVGIESDTGAKGEGTEKANRTKGEGEGEMGFVFETALKYRSFRFGGREGQSISSVCFRKRRIGR